MIGFSEKDKETYYVRLEEGAQRSDPFGFIIPGRYGGIYVHGDGLFGVSTNSISRISKAIRRLPFIRVVQDGDDGINAVFPAEHLKTVAGMVKARRRRKLTPEHRELLKISGSKHQFQGARSLRNRPPDQPDPIQSARPQFREP